MRLNPSCTACKSYDIAQTINYYDGSQRITQLCAPQPFKLIERLADEIATIILRDFGARQTTVEIKKFILSNARHVSFRLTRTA